MTAVRVLVAERQPLFRASLRALLEADPSVVIAGDSEPGPSIHHADVELVVLGVSPMLADTVELCSGLKAHERAPRVLVVDREPDEQRLVELVEGGADGYVTRLDEVDELWAALGSVLAGHPYIPTELLGGLLRSLIDRRRERDEVLRRFESLTKREVEVLAGVCAGHSNEELADRLFISSATTRTHVQNVLRKLEVHSQVEAAALVRRHDLLAEGGCPP